MSLNYILSINNEKSKKLIQNLINENDAENSFSSFEFKSVEFGESEKGYTIKLRIRIKTAVSCAFFEKLSDVLESKTGHKIYFLFEFPKGAAAADNIINYWKFFAESRNELKAWLEHVAPFAEEGVLVLKCRGKIVHKNVSSPSVMKILKTEMRQYFGVIPEIKTAAVKADEIKDGPELVPGAVLLKEESEGESEIIKDEEIKGKITKIENISEEGRYVTEGKVFISGDYKRELKNARGNDRMFVLIFYITDGRDTIKAVTFVKNGDRLIDELPSIGFIRAGIEVKYDEREGELTARVRRINILACEEETDDAAEKRVELHAHTQMSAMDAITGIKAYIETAAAWGHEAAAITDHGVVHAYPEAYKAACEKDIKLILGIEGYLVESTENYKEQKSPYHIILLVKNKKGLKNLYKIVSHSHLKYFYKKPRMPRTEILNHREGLILGTACYQGELFKAALEGKDETELEKIASFYDYLEIQPNENNKFILREGTLKSEEELNGINKKIYSLGRRMGKPVVATGDVHFLKKTDRIYRDVLLLAQGYDEIGEEGSANIYFRNTKDMLKQFSYLGDEAAHEVVIRNPRDIASMIEGRISPVPEKPHPPFIENSDEEISGFTWAGARAIYGNKLPALIEERIKKELNAIIGNKYSVLYLIAKKMVDKSKQDGYIVGSRGSVGSSIVAFLCGISEVNPIQPHYLCPSCKSIEFDDSGLVGVDLPDKKCGKCGGNLVKDGYDIPFETFMGFNGEKMPDIDLNFSGEYQERIHDFVRQLFGDDKVYRAGTIVTIQQQAVKKDFIGKYIEKTKRRIKNAERERLAMGCAGVKRSTGQHAGGLMLVPADKEIYDFTPIQKNPRESAITTHFDYRWVHDALVKIDALGHDLPTSLKRICADLNMDPNDIPLNDRKTMKIFSDIKGLGVNPDNYEHPVGTLGVPEYGTRFTRGMLKTTRPKTFSELIYIAGLSHGTDVWKGNAEELIKAKTASLKEVISVRDDIMNYLIRKGLPQDRAFNITEKVRKGKGLKREDEALMKKNKVPAWYIDSCKKIKYMFPKAHAVAYAIMSFKLAYIKVHEPLYFYADYFNREIHGFEYEFIAMQMKDIKSEIKELKMKRSLEKKEKDRLKVIEVLMEMRERGIEFSEIDLYESEPAIFRVKGGRIRPPLVIVPELGATVAENIEKERKKEKFSSLEDLVKRSKINKNVVEFIKKHKIAGDLPVSDQTVLF